MKLRYRIYADVYFLINFIMDYVALGIVLRLSDIKAGRIRRYVSSIVGASYTCIILKISAPYVLEWGVTYFMIPMIMIIILLGKAGIQRYIRALVLFYIIQYILGGIGNAIYYNTVIGYMARTSEGAWIFIIMLAVLGIICADVIKVLITNRQIYADKIYNVSFEFANHTYKLRALIDTGNNLMDPVYGKCVSVVEKGMLGDTTICLTNPVEYKYHIITYKSLGSSRGFMEVVEVKNVVIENSDHTVRFDSALIGMYEGKMSGDNEYNMLLNGMLMKGGN